MSLALRNTMFEAVVLGIEGVIHVAGAPGDGDGAGLRAACRRLRAASPLAFLDAEDPEWMHLQLAGCGLHAAGEIVLSTRQLGDLARPPRALAFRWLAGRLGVRARSLVYVAGRHDLALAAHRARWSVVKTYGSDAAPDLDVLLERIAAGRLPA